VSTLEHMLPRLGVACELELPGGELRRFGPGAPEFRLILRSDRLLRERLTEFAFARAYVEGDVDVEVHGDVLSLFGIRDALRYGTPLRQALRLGGELLLAAPQLANRKAIQHHYTAGDDLYLTFLDERYHFYSQCLFHRGAETLEEAAEHKLESMWDALGLRPGMRLLDIGGGWGGVAEYCGSRGVHVTSLTLTEESAAFIRRRIRDHGLTAEVVVEDLLDHHPRVPYDHAVIFGVIEHIPTYRRFCARVWDALAPGGRLYLDASATKLKYAGSPFTRHFTWRGPHSCLALQDLTAELLLHGFEIVRVRRETDDYELTMRHWAERFDAAHDEVAARWGEPVFRAFRVFLWGGTHAFRTNRLQAYSLVAERRPDRGPRPRLARRFGQFVLSLR
jgi:cyclopropane-fatty-acyl-phospholipid synthase